MVRCAATWSGISDEIMVMKEAQVERLWIKVDVFEWSRGRVMSWFTPSHGIVRKTIRLLDRKIS